jgi:hypothetical protein
VNSGAHEELAVPASYKTLDRRVTHRYSQVQFRSLE